MRIKVYLNGGLSKQLATTNNVAVVPVALEYPICTAYASRKDEAANILILLLIGSSVKTEKPPLSKVSPSSHLVAVKLTWPLGTKMILAFVYTFVEFKVVIPAGPVAPVVPIAPVEPGRPWIPWRPCGPGGP